MPRGGPRPGSGRPRLSPEQHMAAGTFRPCRHGVRPPAFMPPVLTPTPQAGWQPSPEDFAPLAPRAQAWLRATATLYELSVLDALRVCECLKVLSRVEQLEAAGPSAALRAELKLFQLMWVGLALER